MKTGPKENLSSLKKALSKIVLLQNILGKFVRKCSNRIFWQNNDQCRHFIAAIDQPISLTIFILLNNGRIGHEGQQWPHNRVNLKYMVIFLAPLVYTDLLLADITSTPHNPTVSRYLAWLGFFEFQLNQYSKLTNYFFALAAYKLHALCVNKNFPLQSLPLIIRPFGFGESFSAGRPLSWTQQLFIQKVFCPFLYN